jgi:hypothetical protein
MNALHWIELAKNGVDLRERHQFDFYPTDEDHVKAAFELLPTSFVPETVLDPGMGMGVFGKETKRRWQDSFTVGVELNNDMPLHNWYDWNIRGDFLNIPFDAPFDLVIGNPPYNEAEAFVRRSLAHLRPDGWLVFLLRLSFAESVGRFLMFTHELPPFSVVVCSDRPSFTGDGKTDASAYAYFVWNKGYQGKTILDWVVAEPKKAEKQVYQPSLFEMGAVL